MAPARNRTGAARRGSPLIAASVTLLMVGAVAGCSAPPQGGQPVHVQTGAAPNQDVMPLYTDRATAVAAALKKLPAHVADALKRTGVPGATVAVVSKGKTVYEGAFGVRDKRTGAPVDVNTLFMIASMSKPISATIVARAMTEDPSITWSTPIKDLMPSMTFNDPYVTANATIGDAFAHRTGIPTGGGDELEDLGFDRDYILAHLNQIPLAPFRTTYQYSNFGLTTGAVAVAAFRHETWEQTAKELLFDPLGMTSTTSSHAEFLATRDRAVQHARIGAGDFEPLFDRDPDAEAPAGGVASTAGDVAKWMAVVLDDGKLAGKDFIDPAPLTQAFSAQIVNSRNSALDQRPGHYGFGSNVGSGAGGRVVLSHSGGFELGTATAEAMVPDLDLGIVVLTNGAPIGVPEAVNQQFLDDVLYGAQTRDWVKAYGGVFAHYNAPVGDLAGEKPPAGAAPQAPDADYVGTYTSPYLGTLTITSSGGKLHGAMGPTGGYTFDIDSWDGDTLSFAPTGEGAPPGSLSSAVFTRAGGAVHGVTLAYFDKFAQVPQPSGLGVFTKTG